MLSLTGYYGVFITLFNSNVPVNLDVVKSIERKYDRAVTINSWPTRYGRIYEVIQATPVRYCPRQEKPILGPNGKELSFGLNEFVEATDVGRAYYNGGGMNVAVCDQNFRSIAVDKFCSGRMEYTQKAPEYTNLVYEKCPK